MDNKQETRPYYVAIKDGDGIIWLIPLSSKVEKYKEKIKAYEERHGENSCVLYYIAKLKGKDSAFLIGDAIPVTEKYIVRPFTVNGVAYVMQNRRDNAQLRAKTARFLALVKQGKFKPYVDILGIAETLRP